MATKAMINGTLNLVIVEAENLKKKDLLNKMDPYCVVEFNDETFSTEPHKKGHKNPTWEESLKIPVKGKNLSEKIVFSVYDKELIHDNKIGRAEFTLQKLADLGEKEDLCSIDLETFGLIDKHKPAGTLKIRINFSGDGWPGSEKSESDLPKASAMPSKDDKHFQEQKNLHHFSDVDSGEKSKLDKDLHKHKQYLDDTKDQVPIHSKQDKEKHSTPKEENRIDEPIHSEKKKSSQDHDADINNLDKGVKDLSLTGKKDSNKYDDAFDKDKTKHMDDSQQLKQSDFERDPVKELPKEYRNVVDDQSKTHPKSIQPEKMELGNLEEREPEVHHHRDIPFSQPASDTLGPVGAWSDLPAKEISSGQGPLTTSPTPVKPIEDQDSTNLNTRRGSVGGTCDLKEREKMAEKENATSMLDTASDMLGRGKDAIVGTVAGVSNYLSSDTDKSKTENQQQTGVLPKAKAAISDTVSSVSNYFTGTTPTDQQPRRGSVGGTRDLAEREKYAKLEQVQVATSGIVPRAKAAISDISTTLSSVTKPVSDTVSNVTNYFAGLSTTDQQPRRGSVGGTRDLAEREKYAKLEQVQVATSGIVPTAKAAISTTTAAISDTVSSVTNYFTGTPTDQQPRRGSVGGTRDLAEREKYAKLEQVEEIKSGIVPAAKAAISTTTAAISNTVSSVSNYFTGTTPTDQPRRGSVGGTCDLAEREKYAKLEQVQVATSGIVPTAKAAISNISNTLSSVAKPVSETVSNVTNYFTGSTTTDQPRRGSVGGTCDLAEREKYAKLEQVEDVKSGIVPAAKAAISTTTAAISNTVSSVSNYFTGTTPTDQPRRGSVGGTCDLAEREKYAKIEQVQDATSGIVPKAKAAISDTISGISNTVASVSNYFTGQKDEQQDVTQEPQMDTVYDGQQHLDQIASDKGIIERGKDYIADTAAYKAVSDYMAPTDKDAPWKKEQQFHEGNTPSEQLPATSLVNPIEMIPHDMRDKSLFQKGKEAFTTVSDTATTTATNLKNYFAADTKESSDPNDKGLVQKAKESITSVMPSAQNEERAPWKKEQYQEGNISSEEVPATSLVNPNEMIPHDMREKSLFQKGKEALENAATSVKTDSNKSQFYDPQFQSDKEKMLQENNSNQLNIKDSLDQGKPTDLSYQNPDLAYHTQDV
jgi:membrane protein YqaA with SNARE-associated domain